MRKPAWWWGIFAVILAVSCPANAGPQDVKVLEFVIDKDVRQNALDCYTTSTGITIKTIDECPAQADVEREINALFKRIGAKPGHLHGHDVTFTNRRVLSFIYGGWRWMHGVTYWRNPKQWWAPWFAFSVVSTHGKPAMDTFIHELGHAAFAKIGMDSKFLDTKEPSPEKDAVLDRTKRLPKDHPARKKFQKT